ncbi:MarR family winged helix-turn-helix transcriptional regulator [Actinomadura sp. 9N407]|uniref:MarR family winged helix-turn-helix transcriptional regulator n=1 Tax=Actinomadura sp. 9N407 TaxID=3375154 RepID=UPI0037B348A7
MTTAPEPEGIVQEFGALLAATALLERIAARELERRCGIRHPVFEVLLRLSRAGADGGHTMGFLAGEMILTSGGMTRLVDRMERDGYVRRRAASGDRRRHLVELTEAGRDKLAEALRVHAETLDRHFAAPLSDEARRHLVAATVTLREHARRDLGDLG